jgi:hypothetical protein
MLAKLRSSFPWHAEKGNTLAMKANDLTFDEKLDRAANRIIRSRAFFDIYWFCASKETRSLYINIMNFYPDFFRFLENANFIACATYMGALCEKRADTINLHSLAEEMKRQDLNSVGEEAIKCLTENDDLLCKIAQLRNNVFVHLNAKLPVHEHYRRIGITPDQLKKATDIAFGILNSMRRAMNKPEIFVRNTPAYDLRAILKALGEHHSINT